MTNVNVQIDGKEFKNFNTKDDYAEMLGFWKEKIKGRVRLTGGGHKVLGWLEGKMVTVNLIKK